MLDFLFGRMFYMELFLAGLFITANIPRRDKFWLRLPLAAAGCIAFSYVWSTLFGGLLAPLYSMLSAVVSYLIPFIVVLAAMCFCVELRGYSVLFVGAAMWFTQHFASVLDSVLFPGNGMNYRSYVIHIVYTIAVFAVAYFLFFRDLNCQVIECIDLSTAVPIWFVMCLACLVLGTYAENVGENSLSFKLMNLLCTAIGLLYQNGLYTMCGLKRERDGVQQLLEESEERYELAKRNTELINIKCHDLRHIIRHFQQQGKLNEEVFTEMEHSIREYDSAIKTGCSALDVILSEKSAQCVSLGIGLTCMADASGLSYIKPVDLYVLFGNALENAIEATQSLADPEKKQISLTVRRAGCGMCSVYLQNYTDHPLQFVGDVPLTIKQDKQNHGFGVKSMRMLAERYDGELHFRQDGDVVELYLLLPWKEEAEAC